MELVAEKYKQTEVGLIPSDWELVELGSISNISSGGTPNRGIAAYWNGDIPWVTTSQIDFNTINQSFEFITEEGLNNSAAKIYKKGTLLMAMYGQGKTRGKVAILGIDATTNQACAAIYVNKDILKEYVFCNLSGRYDEIRNLSNTGNQENLSGELIKKILIPIPPTKAEQTAIATALSDADALISSLEKLIAKKRMIKQGAMQQLLQPKEGWEVKKLPELVWFQEGPGVRNSQFTSSGVKLLNGTNIEDGKLLLEKTDRYISEKEAYGWYSHFLVNEGDILIACSGVTIDRFDEKVTIANSSHLPLCMNTSTMRFKIISKDLSKAYFLHFLKSKLFKEQIGGKATGSAQLNFGPSHVKMVDLSFPTLIEQENISSILSDMDAEITAVETKLVKYRKVKLGMMQNLLTGKIRLV